MKALLLRAIISSLMVVSAVGQTPVIAGILREGAKDISGTTAAPPAAPCAAHVEVHDISNGDILLLLNSTPANTVAATGGFAVTLQEPLRGGQKIQVDEIFQNCGAQATQQSTAVEVIIPGDWGRIKGYFTSGILLSQDQNNFSQSSLFLSFILDKTWRMPGYYHPVSKGPGAGTRMGHWPGINSFFDTRLTSIPVSACSVPNASTPSSSQSPCATTPSATSTQLDTFLSQRKTARLAVGVYFPWTVTSWAYNNTHNALFLAPLAKVGFDTPAGDLTQAQPSSTAAGTTGSTVTAVNPTSFYNFHGYGGRIGHYSLTSSRNQAPELVSYLDVIFGPFSNLETLVTPKTAPPTATPFRKRMYRLALEGILKVPSTPLIVGFSANVGQEAVGLGQNNIVQRAGDDLRFLFGVKFDAAKLMAAIIKIAP